MAIVVPSILTASREDLEGKLKQLSGLVETVQIDIVDGRFIGPPTWPYASTHDLDGLRNETGWLSKFGHFKYEVDLMVEYPEETAGFWIAAGATAIVVHIESTRYLPALINQLKEKYGYEKGFAPDLLSFGLALNIETETSLVEPFLDSADYVQFMGIDRIGKQGQHFDAKVIDKLRKFRKAHPDVEIQVDGGASLETAPVLLAVGVDRLVVGSDLWHAPDLYAQIQKIEALSEDYGRYHQR